MKNFEQKTNNPKRDFVHIFVGLLAESYAATLIAANDNDTPPSTKKEPRP